LANKGKTSTYYTEIRKTKREENGAAVLDVPLAKVVEVEQIKKKGRDTDEGRGEGKQRECLCSALSVGAYTTTWLVMVT
jgi:hypothetical protein